MSPQARWPLIQISVSGFAPATWDDFRDMTERLRVTVRAALEEAIGDLVRDVEAGKAITWPHTKSGKSHTLQLHEKMHLELQRMVRDLGYRQNVIVIAAIERWMAQRQHK